MGSAVASIAALRRVGSALVGAQLGATGGEPRDIAAHHRPPTLTLPRKGGGRSFEALCQSPPPLRGRVRVGGAAAIKCSVRKPLLAPQAELVVHRPVGKAEEDGVLLGAMAVRRPARHDEDVALLPGEALVADPRLAL